MNSSLPEMKGSNSFNACRRVTECWCIGVCAWPPTPFLVQLLKQPGVSFACRKQLRQLRCNEGSENSLANVKQYRGRRGASCEPFLTGEYSPRLVRMGSTEEYPNVSSTRCRSSLWVVKTVLVAKAE